MSNATEFAEKMAKKITAEDTRRYKGLSEHTYGAEFHNHYYMWDGLSIKEKIAAILDAPNIQETLERYGLPAEKTKDAQASLIEQLLNDEYDKWKEEDIRPS